jgi:CRISPR-associated protein Cmx8
MGKKRVAAATATDTKPKAAESISVVYDLFDLPTAQHKAGLAGLILQINHMNGSGKHPKPKAVPRVTEMTATSATIEFTEESVQCLFDDVYAAERATVRVKGKWNSPEVRPSEEIEEEIEAKDADGKPVKKKVKVRYFFHHQVQPAGNVQRQFIRNSPDVWLKLWRDMVWNITRGIPKTRLPFEQRADGKPCKEGADAWADLQKFEKARRKGEWHTDAVPSSLWLGAQSSNAELVAFEGRVEQTLLLHFWTAVAQVYVPQAVERDGSSEFVGYVLAIPEVADLKSFTEDYPRMLGELGDDVRGYLPAEAVIHLPAEGALSFLDHLSHLIEQTASGTETALSLGSIEFMHLDKKGNSIKTLSAGRVVPRPGLLARYHAVVGKVGEKPPYANPLFRRGLMQAVLDDRKWFEPFGVLFAEWEASIFVPTDAPPAMPKFWIDARKYVQEVIQAMSEAPRPDDSPPDPDDILMMLVHRLTRTYLALRAEQKSGINPEKFKEEDKINWAKLPKEYQDARRAAAESLFLEFRSRKGQAFVEHFAQTFFAAKQFLSEAQYSDIGRALFAKTDNVKTLTLMALSANS